MDNRSLLIVQHIIPYHIFIWCTLFLLTSLPVSTAQVYTLNKTSDIALGSSILGLSVLDLALRQSTPVLTADDIMRLDRQELKAIDRFAVGRSSPQAASWSDYLHFSAMAMPLLLTTSQLTKKDYGVVGLLLLETVAANASMTFLTKYAVKRPRPFVYDPAVSLTDKQSSSARLSFVSGHTSSTASLGFFTAKVFSDLNPTSKWKPVVWTVGLVLPAVVGALRVSAGRHFVTDVVAGYVLGGLIGWGIPMLHKGDQDIELMFGMNGGIGLRYQLDETRR